MQVPHRYLHHLLNTYSFKSQSNHIKHITKHDQAPKVRSVQKRTKPMMSVQKVQTIKNGFGSVCTVYEFGNENLGGRGGHCTTALHQHTEPMTSQCYTHTTEQPTTEP